MDRKMIDGQVHYFLKWKGYADCENSWEPAKGLFCPELVVQFLETFTGTTKNESTDNKKNLRQWKEARRRSKLIVHVPLLSLPPLLLSLDRKPSLNPLQYNKLWLLVQRHQNRKI
eukprot:TRINITY_DN2990_c0_g1_i1.p1 TRINITY_DN2990_c0_g1~~TRINITY_DN2990_c0_g1_i1.p1  ORF type:complete len:115 (-),score=16.78 TRINITY_DN2990_c0_g1_i1:57-401(-)